MTDHSTGGPLPPDRIDLPVYRAVEGLDTPIGSTVYAWGPAGPDGVRSNLGTGRLIGWLKRERAYSQIEGRYEGTAYFNIAEHWHRATDRNDVALAVVEGPDGRYLPSYPRCPDCGGAVADKRAKAEREFGPFQWAEPDQGPGSRECAECGSRFIDTRYGDAREVPAGATDS